MKTLTSQDTAVCHAYAAPACDKKARAAVSRMGPREIMLRARANGLGYGGAPAGVVESARRPRNTVGGKPQGRVFGASRLTFIPSWRGGFDLAETVSARNRTGKRPETV